MYCCKMASYGSNLEVWENYSVKNLIKVQSCVRRWLVKNMVKEIKRLYSNVVIDLEGQETEIIWPRETLSCPAFRKVNKSATDLLRIKECSYSSNHEVSQLPASKQSTSIPGSQISLDTKDKTVKQQNSVSTEAQTESTYNGLVLTPTSKPGYQLSSNMEDSSLKQQNFVSAEAQTESTYNESDLTPASNSMNPCHKALRQALQCLVDATENTNSNMSALNIGYGENKSLHPQNSGLLPSVHCKGTDDEVQSVIGPVSHSGAQISQERLHPDNDDGETYEKSFGINNSVAQDSEVISELGKPMQQALSIQKEVTTISRDLPDDKEQLLQLKSTMAMELLWVQQAINSRKNYLRLKQGLQ